MSTPEEDAEGREDVAPSTDPASSEDAAPRADDASGEDTEGKKGTAGKKGTDGEATPKEVPVSDPKPDDEEPKKDALACLPAPVACDSDAQCRAGWICAPVDNDLPGFAEVERGCLPPGLVAVLAGDLDVAGGEGRDENDVAATRGESAADPRIPGVAIDSDAPNVSGTQGGTEGAGGCNVTASREHDGKGLGAVLFGLGLLLSFRRRRSA